MQYVKKTPMVATAIKLSPSNMLGSNDASAIATAVGLDIPYTAPGEAKKEPTGIFINIVSPNNGFAAGCVKLDGLKHPVTEELLAQKNGAVNVKFKGLTSSFYVGQNNTIYVSMRAESVEVLP